MYFFTQVLIKKDGSYDRSTAGFDTRDLAEKEFHQGMVSAINKQEYDKAIMFVFDSEGTIKFKRVWERL